jgi:hypothetical protein
MYEFIKTETGWLVCWGPPPVWASEGSTPARGAHQTRPAADHLAGEPSVNQVLNGRSSASHSHPVLVV